MATLRENGSHGSDTDSARDPCEEHPDADAAPEDDPAADAAPKSRAAPPASAGAEDGRSARRKFTHTTEAQRRSMIEWLEQPPNFQLLARRAPPVLSDTGKKLKKADGFRSLMRHMNATTQCDWDLETTRSRYESLLHAFRKTKQMVEHPDFEVTPNDRTRGIMDVRQKRNALCLFYDRLDALATTGVALDADSKSKSSDREASSLSESTRAAAAAPASAAEASPASASAESSALRPSRPVAIAPKGTVAISRTPAPLPTPEQEDANWRRLAAHPVAIAPAPGSSAAATSGLQSAVGALSLETAEATASSGGSGAGTPPPPAFKLPTAKRVKYRHASGAASTETPSAKQSSETSAGASPSVVTHAAVLAADASIGSSERVRLKELEVEAQKLALQQQQLQLQTRELDLKEKELAAQGAMKKQALRAELTTKLIAAGTSFAEIKEYLALLDG